MHQSKNVGPSCSEIQLLVAATLKECFLSGVATTSLYTCTRGPLYYVHYFLNVQSEVWRRRDGFGGRSADSGKKGAVKCWEPLAYNILHLDPKCPFPLT